MLESLATLTTLERGADAARVELPLTLRRAWQRELSCLALQYQDAAGRIVPGHWHAHAEQTVAEFERLDRKSGRGVLARAGDELVLLQPDGADLKLPALGELLERPGAELVAHRPGRRAVVRLPDPAGVLFAKALRPGKIERVVQANRFIADLDARAFAIAQTHSISDAEGLILTRELAGRCLHDLAKPDPDAFVRGCALAGTALRSLHTAPPSWLAVHDADAEAAMLRSRAAGVAEFLPEVYKAVGWSIERVCRALTEQSNEHVVLHRDFYDKQIVLGSDSEIGLLDFDTLGAGEAALDIANMLAHLELRVLQGDCRCETAGAAATGFLSAYAPSETTEARIPAYLDAARLRLAMLYAFRPRWSHLTHVLLDSIGMPLIWSAESRAAIPGRATTAKEPAMQRSSRRGVCPLMFVVGCPRSGTTMLERMLNAHRDVAMTHETHWVTKHARRGRDLTHDGCVRPETLDALYRDERFVRMAPARQEIERLMDLRPLKYRRFVRVVFDHFRREHGKAFVGDKSTGSYVRRIDRLRKICPDSKIVHLVRDGREVCLSMMNWPKASRAAGRFGMFSEDPVGTTAAWWQWHVRTGMRQGRALGPGVYREVRYEELVHNSATECAALCEFLGIDADPAMINFHSNKPRSARGDSANAAWLPPTPGLRDWRTQMTEEQIEMFEAIAGDTLASLGYERRFPRVSPRVAGLAAERVAQWNHEVRDDSDHTGPGIVIDVTGSPIREGEFT